MIFISLFIYSDVLRLLSALEGESSKMGKIDDSTNSNSILLTQYSYEASQLIKSFKKNISFVVLILILIASMTIFDLLMDLGFTNILSVSDETIDAMIIGVSVFLILFTIFMIRPVFRSQKILERWSNLFDKNAIRTGIILSINNKSKEEVLVALSETIEQIGTPLQDYLSKSDHSEFYDVSIDGTTFDILIDKSTVKPIDANSLKSTIQDYGSILVKITASVINKDITQSFITSLQEYRKQGNKIGLAMMIGGSISQESYNLVSKIKDKTISDSLIFIEKSDNTDCNLENLNKVLA
jgi:hypothetical protein